MSSAEDADDERESPAPPVSRWVDPKSLNFTVFVVLPNDDVCTMRDVPSGTSVFDLKGKLEITAGIPSQIYTLMYPDGEEITDDQKLLVQENIIDGYLIKMHLTDNWEGLYTAVERNNIEHVYHSGGVHLKGNIVISPDESERYESLIRERGSVALYMASFFGHQRMVSMLLTVGVNVNGMTHLGRTALHAAVAKDRLAVLGLLLKFGASIRKPDYFGMTPLELSRELSSNACTKKLRLMQLNLRGNAEQKSPTKANNERTTSNRASKNGQTTFEPPRLLSRAQTAEGFAKYKETTAFGAQRTVSNMSQYSEMSDLSKSPHGQQPMHKSRKNVISSAPDRVIKNKLVFRKCTPSPTQTNNTHILQPKRIVRWRDIPKENMYWQVIELPNKAEHAIEKAVSVKPVAIIQQKKILKFASANGTSPSPELCPAAPSATPTLDHPRQHREEPKVNEKIVRFTQARLRHFRKLNKNLDTTRTMRRRIRIAVEHEKTSAVRESSQAFKEWLERKARESEESEDGLESLASAHESDDDVKETLKEFNKRVRKRNRIETRVLTPGNRPIPDIIKVGSTKVGDSSNPPAFTNITAYNEWKNQRVVSGNSDAGEERGRSVNDFMVERQRLEEKRQKLLLTAITYDEWMDHVEDRKFLIKQILKADYEEMKKLEEDRFKDRFNANSYDKWKEKLQQREEEEKKRKVIQRKYDEERTLDRIRAGKASNAAAFKEWLNRKRDTGVPAAIGYQPRAQEHQQRLNHDAEAESAYGQWITRKHLDEPKHLESQVEKERERLGAMRQLRTETVA